ncbi:MAG: Gfo/Idh/MocA family protein [Christensenellales bacterium]|jgi:NDP-hexose-3-ketoreductase
MIRLGILGCASIADRMFLPAIKLAEGIECVGVASRNKTKCEVFAQKHGISAYGSYDELINDDGIDAIYIPLPPSLHHEYAKKAMLCGKHVMVEKPATVSLRQAEDLVATARQLNVALHENYMFAFHSQLSYIINKISSGELGQLRLIRSSFGFPLREANDFRYNKELGGGALLDAGGYPIKLCGMLLGQSARLVCAQGSMLPGYDVDMYGSASFVNDEGLVCQIAYGFDNSYMCSLEIWGSKARLTTNRIFTAPPQLRPTINIESSNGREVIELEADNHFRASIDVFSQSIIDADKRQQLLDGILKQSSMMENVKQHATANN